MSAAPPATQSEPAPAAEAAPKRRLWRRWPVLLLVAALLGGAAAWMLTSEGAGAEGEDPKQAAGEPAEVEEGEILDVGTLTTNLAGANPRYARVGVALVLSAGTPSSAVQPDLPLVKDALITEISSHSAGDVQGREGVEALRKTLTRAVTGLFDDQQVVRVVLTELLVQ